MQHRFLYSTLFLIAWSSALKCINSEINNKRLAAEKAPLLLPAATAGTPLQLMRRAAHTIERHRQPQAKPNETRWLGQDGWLRQKLNAGQERAALFLMRHPNKASDALLTRFMLTCNGYSKFMKKHSTQAEKAFTRLAANHFVELTAKVPATKHIPQQPVLWHAINYADKGTVAKLTAPALQRFTRYIQGDGWAGSDDGQLLVGLMQKNNAIAEHFGNVMLANLEHTRQRLDCSNFRYHFFRGFAEIDPTSTHKIIEAGKNAGWSAGMLAPLYEYVIKKEAAAPESTQQTSAKK